MLLKVCGLLVAASVRDLTCAVCCLLLVDRRGSFVVCLWCVVCSVVFTACCVLVSSVVRCSLCVVCCLSFAVVR